MAAVEHPRLDLVLRRQAAHRIIAVAAVIVVVAGDGNSKSGTQQYMAACTVAVAGFAATAATSNAQPSITIHFMRQTPLVVGRHGAGAGLPKKRLSAPSGPARRAGRPPPY